MPVLDAAALNTDPEGLEFLSGVLGTSPVASGSARRFPVEAWTPKMSFVAPGSDAPIPSGGSEEAGRQFADAAA